MASTCQKVATFKRAAQIRPETVLQLQNYRFWLFWPNIVISILSEENGLTLLQLIVFQQEIARFRPEKAIFSFAGLSIFSGRRG